jgi:hypothetical protein
MNTDGDRSRRNDIGTERIRMTTAARREPPDAIEYRRCSRDRDGSFGLRRRRDHSRPKNQAPTSYFAFERPIVAGGRRGRPPRERGQSPAPNPTRIGRASINSRGNSPPHGLERDRNSSLKGRRIGASFSAPWRPPPSGSPLRASPPFGWPTRKWSAGSRTLDISVTGNCISGPLPPSPRPSPVHDLSLDEPPEAPGLATSRPWTDR